MGALSTTFRWESCFCGCLTIEAWPILAMYKQQRSATSMGWSLTNQPEIPFIGSELASRDPHSRRSSSRDPRTGAIVRHWKREWHNDGHNRHLHSQWIMWLSHTCGGVSFTSDRNTFSAGARTTTASSTGKSRFMTPDPPA